MSEITTLNTNADWTASTNVSWITISPTEGKAGRPISVTVTPAENPSDPSTGTITIQTESDTITREIKRCLPKVVDRTGRIEYTLMYNGSVYTSGTIVAPCNNGKETSSNKGISVDKVKLRYKVTLDNEHSYYDPATDAPDSEQIYLKPSEYNVWYVYPDGTKSSTLTKNTEKERTVTVLVELKSDTSINCKVDSQCKSFKQGGLKDSSGNYDESMFVPGSIRQVNTAYTYENFAFASSCINKSSTNCKAGTFNYSVSGKKYLTSESTTGKTICGDVITLKGKTKEDKGNITINDVEFSFKEENVAVQPTDCGFAPNSNVFQYSANKSLTNNRVFTITAKLKNVQGVSPISTKYTVVKSGTNGTSCVGSLVTHTELIENKKYAAQTGETMNVKIWITEDSTVVTDSSLLSKLKIEPEQVGATVTINGGFDDGYKKYKIAFSPNSNEDGRDFSFITTCKDGNNDLATPSELSIYQLGTQETALPNFDYFVFYFDWNPTSDNRNVNLASYTVIRNIENFVDDEGKDISTRLIGPKGFAETENFQHPCTLTRNIVNNSDGLILAKHGGNNGGYSPKTEHGNEGSIICMRNILGSNGIDVNSVVHVDVYGTWFGFKADGKMSVDYKLYTGETSIHDFNTEIKSEEYCNNEGTSHTIFSNKENNASLIIAGTITNRTVKATTYDTNIIPSIGQKMVCLDNAFSKVFRLKYIVNKSLPIIRTFGTPGGYDEYGYLTKIYVSNYSQCVPQAYHSQETPYTSPETIITFNKDAHSVVLENVYGIRKYDNIVKNKHIFTEDYGSGIYGEYISALVAATSDSIIYDYNDFINGTAASFDSGFITNFKVTQRQNEPQGNVNISFNLSENTTGRDRAFSIFLYIVDKEAYDCKYCILSTCMTSQITFYHLAIHQTKD